MVSTMPNPIAETADKAPFDYERWSEKLPVLSKVYASAEPYPNIALEDFLEEEAVQKAIAEFPGPGDTEWIQYKHYNENKLGKSKREEFPPFIGSLVDELNSPRFVSWLSELTGIPGLMADPMLEGGGMHQTESGGFLNMHADFTMHHYHKRWRRRVNLIVYLNEKWEAEWGGDLELWDREMKGCVTKIAPIRNQAAIFNTDDTSYHGYPDPITCPKDVTRKSIALYYFTEEKDARYHAKSTNYQARPTDGSRRIFIWLDKKALHVYTKLKERFGFSDDFVSRLLRRGKKK